MPSTWVLITRSTSSASTPASRSAWRRGPSRSGVVEGEEGIDHGDRGSGVRTTVHEDPMLSDQSSVTKCGASHGERWSAATVASSEGRMSSKPGSSTRVTSIEPTVHVVTP